MEAEEATGPMQRAHVSVERRADPRRRDGHRPPVIASAEGPTLAVVFQELYELVRDNVALARCIRSWQARRRDGY